MKKSFFLLFGLLLMSVCFFSSCDEESNSVDPYANWKVRNERFLDSIADVAKAKPSEWKIIRAYSQTGSDNSGSLVPNEGEVSDYIYVKVLQDAGVMSENEGGRGLDACRNVLFTDSVYVHYCGQLMNGETFDKSYTTSELDYELATPVKMAVSDVVNGFSTALQNMHEGDRSLNEWQYKGDRWLVYIPYQLGYGTTDQESIPKYSVLVFDIALAHVWGVGEKPVWNGN